MKKKTIKRKKNMKYEISKSKKLINNQNKICY